MDPNNLYPTLPNPEDSGITCKYSSATSTDSGTTFRLQQISEIKSFLEKEIEYRRAIYMKYKKAFNIMTYIGHASAVISAGSGAVSLTSLSNILAAPIGFTLGGIAIASTAVAFGLNFGKKKILQKIEKHEKISTLAVSKLNTINDLVSKAISDSHISQEEFALILREKEKYIEMRNAVRRKHIETNTSTSDVEELKKTFLEEGKKIAQSEMITKLTKQD